MQCNSAMATWLVNVDINGDETLSMFFFWSFLFILLITIYRYIHAVHTNDMLCCLGPGFLSHCTYRFIYYHKWQMSPPPQRSHFTTEGSSSGPIFLFFFFILFTTLYRFMYQHKQQMLPPPPQLWGIERGDKGNAQEMLCDVSWACGMFFFFWFSFIFILLTFFFRYNAHIFKQSPSWTATTTKQRMANTA